MAIIVIAYHNNFCANGTYELYALIIMYSLKIYGQDTANSVAFLIKIVYKMLSNTHKSPDMFCSLNPWFWSWIEGLYVCMLSSGTPISCHSPNTWSVMVKLPVGVNVTVENVLCPAMD